MENGDARVDGRAFDLRPELVKFLRGLRRFAVPAQRHAVVTEQPVPVLFAPGGATAPAEPEQPVATVRELLVRDEPDLTGPRVAAKRAPAAGAGRLFHHPEILLFEPAHQVGGAGGVVHDLGRAEDRVVVPTHEIEVRAEFAVVQCEVERHRVVRDELFRADFPDDPQLIRLETDVEIRVPPPPVEPKPRIMRTGVVW